MREHWIKSLAQQVRERSFRVRSLVSTILIWMKLPYPPRFVFNMNGWCESSFVKINRYQLGNSSLCNQYLKV